LLLEWERYFITSKITSHIVTTDISLNCKFIYIKWIINQTICSLTHKFKTFIYSLIKYFNLGIIFFLWSFRSFSSAASRTGGSGASQLTESPLPSTRFPRQVPERRTFHGVDRRQPVPPPPSVPMNEPLTPDYSQDTDYGGLTPDYSQGRHKFLDKLASKLVKK